MNKVSQTGSSVSRSTVWILLALAALTLAVYAPVRHYAFVSIDDPLYVSQNPHVTGGFSATAIAWAFTSGYAANWHPLTWLSHMLDVELHGVNAGGHHVTNLVLHVLSTLLLFVVLRRLTNRVGPSAVVAALFAVHPLHVESVAWVAERKDVLSGFLWMTTLLAYARYARTSHAALGTSHAAQRTSHVAYFLVLLSFALGLMAKPMLVTLPFVLLLLDYWPLGRLTLQESERPTHTRALLWEKLPLVALAAVSMIITVLVQQRGGAVSQLAAVPLPLRVGNTLIAYLTYAVKMVWPTNLIVFYRYPTAISPAAAVGAAIALAAISALAIRFATSRPYLLVGWLWYLVTLLPVVGLVQVGRQAMADRYTYLPLVGLFIIAAWGVSDLLAFSGRHRGRPLQRHILPLVAALVVIFFAVAARAQVSYWANSQRLWQRALDVDPANYYAHNSLGSMALDEGRIDDAIRRFTDAVRFGPDYPEAYNNLGLALARRGQNDAAMAQYRTALQINPGLAEAHDNLGAALAAKGSTAEAVGEYETAIRMKPGVALFHENLGKALASRGSVPEAIAQFEEALRLQPTLASAHGNLGKALASQGRTAEAIARYTEALRLDPNLVDAHNNLGVALSAQGKPGEAIAHYKEALRLQPDQPDVHSNLGVALAATGNASEAVAHCSEAIRLRPDSAVLHYNLGFVLAGQGRTAEAVPQFSDALRLQPDLAPAHTSLALALAAGGRLAEALPHFAEAVRLQPGSDTARQYFGIALAGAGRFDEAIAELREAVRLNPANDVAKRALEMAITRAGTSAAAQQTKREGR
jgi:protein O-mannosyl-transferase